MTTVEPRTCPTPAKKLWATRSAAVDAMANIMRRRRPRWQHVRAYQCVTGHWHLTSRRPKPRGGPTC